MLTSRLLNNRLLVVTTLSSLMTFGLVQEALSASFLDRLKNTGVDSAPGQIDPNWQILNASVSVPTGVNSVVE